MKLKHREIKPLREELLKRQNNRCLLCEQSLTIEDAVLDHNHKTGAIRGTIHRNCNLYIGKMENNLQRNKITFEMLQNILNNFIVYIQRDEGYIHPTYKTPEERKMAYKKKKKKTPKPKKKSY